MPIIEGDVKPASDDCCHCIEPVALTKVKFAGVFPLHIAWFVETEPTALVADTDKVAGVGVELPLKLLYTA